MRRIAQKRTSERISDVAHWSGITGRRLSCADPGRISESDSPLPEPVRSAILASKPPGSGRWVTGGGYASFRPGNLTCSAKGEGVGFGAGIEKVDLERAIGDRPVLPDKLIELLSVHDTLAVGIDVGAMAVARWLAIDRDTEPDGLAVCRAEHEVEIAGVEPVDNAAVFAVEGKRWAVATISTA